MYLAAIDEGRLRQEEAALTSHLKVTPRLTPERIQRMSVFRVKKFYDEINTEIESLAQWATSKQAITANADGVDDNGDWQWTSPISVGDPVEADLGGALFPATVTRVSDGSYDVEFFDGDIETNLTRSHLRLTQRKDPAAVMSQTEPPAGMTAKQLKRWKKQQEKLGAK
jgi:hypothetical protein